MNQIATRDTSINQVGISTGNGSKIAPQTLGEVVRFAEVMCKADIALPKHLRGNAGACMAVALQALEWEMSPFAVASKSYAVNGQIAYEAQLIAAVVNTRSGIEGRLKYRYEGEGADMVCFVTGKVDGEELEYESPRVGDITPKNSPLWKTDPRQQLGYYSARSWARRHTPEVILGVYDRDEAEQFRGPDHAKDVTPRPSLAERLSAPQGGAQAREGFDMAHVSRATEEAPQDEPDELATEPAEAADKEEAEAPVTETPDPFDNEAADGQSAPSASSNPDDDDKAKIRRRLMEECIENILRDATSEPASDRLAKIDKAAGVWKGELPDDTAFVDKVAETARRIVEKPGEKQKARDYLLAKVAP